jgi:hypothetical protein
MVEAVAEAFMVEVVGFMAVAADPTAAGFVAAPQAEAGPIHPLRPDMVRALMRPLRAPIPVLDMRPGRTTVNRGPAATWLPAASDLETHRPRGLLWRTASGIPSATPLQTG